MIKLLNIVQEIIVGPRDALAQKKVQKYIRDGSQGDLNLVGTEIEYLPNNLKQVGGYFDLSNTPIRSLPNDLIVWDSLDLNGTPIQSLPDGLKVVSYLDLTNAPIKSLPEDLGVGGTLNLRNTPIQSLPNGLKVGGSLVLYNCKSLKSLPNNLEVENDLFLQFTPLSKKYTTVEQLKAKYPDLKVKGDILL